MVYRRNKHGKSEGSRNGRQKKKGTVFVLLVSEVEKNGREYSRKYSRNRKNPGSTQ